MQGLIQAQHQFFNQFRVAHSGEREFLCRSIPEGWFDAPDFAQKYFNQVGNLYFCPEWIREDLDWVKSYINRDSGNIRYIGERLRSNRLLARWGFFLNPKEAAQHFDEAFLKEEEFFEIALYKHPREVLAYFDERFRRSKVHVKRAVMACPDNLQYADFRFRDDYYLVKTAVKIDGSAIQYASHRLQQEKSIAMAAVSNNGNMYPLLSDELKRDWDIIEAVLLNVVMDDTYHAIPVDLLYHPNFTDLLLEAEIDYLGFLPYEMRDQEELMVSLLDKSNNMLKYCSFRLRCDREFVRIALRHSLENLEYAVAELRDDRGLVEWALRQGHSSGFQFVSQRLRDHEEIAQLALSANIWNFRYLSSRLRNEEKWVRMAVEERPNILSEVGERWRDNKSLIMELLEIEQYNISFLGFISERLKSDEEILERAIQIHGDVLLEFHPRFLQDREWVLRACRTSNQLLNELPADWYQDREVLEQLLRCPDFKLSKVPSEWAADAEIGREMHSGLFFNFEYLDPVIQRGEDCWEHAFEMGISFYQYLPLEVRRRKDLIMRALDNSGDYILPYLPLEALEDIEIIEKIAEKGHGVILWMHPAIQERRDLVKKILAQSGGSLKFLKAELRADKELAMLAIESDGMAVAYVDEALRKDEEIVIMAIHTDYRAYRYVDLEELFDDDDL